MDDDLTKLSDEELLRRFINNDCEAGEPECDAIAAEVQRRELDV